MGSNYTILYVDDEPINLMLFRAIFERKYTVLTAESGAKGLTLLSQNPGIAGVISDMRMPLMNGIEFIRLARKDFPDIFYFILTGYDITAEISSALNEKLIDRYFQKPFNHINMEESIKEAIEKSTDK
jgi:two-component system, response regulator, stage 0 sporulation protein F